MLSTKANSTNRKYIIKSFIYFAWLGFHIHNPHIKARYCTCMTWKYERFLCSLSYFIPCSDSPKVYLNRYFMKGDLYFIFCLQNKNIRSLIIPHNWMSIMLRLRNSDHDNFWNILSNSKSYQTKTLKSMQCYFYDFISNLI